MVKGIVFALAACSVWGLLFVIPQFLNGFSTIEITLGCYLFYGLISIGIFLTDRSRGKCCYPWAIWYKASYFSLISTIIYYTCVVLALRYATPATCALIMGTSPIVIAFYGNFKRKECRFRSLLIPSFLMVLGIIVLNTPQFGSNQNPVNYLLGLIFGFVGLISWGWYVVENSQFLKENPEVQSGDWSTLVGVATLFWVAFSAVVTLLFFRDHIDLNKFLLFDKALAHYALGCAILGLICTWLAAFFWNRSSMLLPVPLLGQLAIFETLFGLLYVYTFDQRLPSPVESLGISLLLGAVIYGIRSISQIPKPQPVDLYR